MEVLDLMSVAGLQGEDAEERLVDLVGVRQQRQGADKGDALPAWPHLSLPAEVEPDAKAVAEVTVLLDVVTQQG